MLSVDVPFIISCEDAFWMIVNCIVDEQSGHKRFVERITRSVNGVANDFARSLMCAQQYSSGSFNEAYFLQIDKSLLKEDGKQFYEQVGFPVMKELFSFRHSRAWVNVEFSLCQIANFLLYIQKSRVTDFEALDYADRNKEAFRKYLASVAALPKVDSRFRHAKYSAWIEQELLKELCDSHDPLIGWLPGGRRLAIEGHEVTPEMGLVRAFCHAHSAMAEKGAA